MKDLKGKKDGVRKLSDSEAGGIKGGKGEPIVNPYPQKVMPKVDPGPRFAPGGPPPGAKPAPGKP